MSDLPDPPITADVDIRGFSGFMLNVDRLLASELVALATPEQGWHALMLWCRAWQQSPPGSLPNDDNILAAFSRAGTRWKKVKPIALRGFVLCSDGRLYHKFLCDEAMAAWSKRKAYRNDQERLKKWREAKKETPPETDGETSVKRVSTPVSRNVSEPDRQGQGQGQKDSGLRPLEPPDPKAELWRSGLATLGRLTGRPTGPTRKFLGRLLDLAGGDHERLLALIGRAETEQPDDVAAWLTAGVKIKPADLFSDDPFGIRAWIAAQADATLEWFDGGKRQALALRGWDLERTAIRVSEAARLSPRWRGRWDALGDWLREGIEPDDIVRAITRSASRAGYEAPGTLNYFDKPVRESVGRVAA